MGRLGGKMDEIYHALRVSFLAGREGVPWHMVCHALREGLNLDCKTYVLREKDYEEFPLLRELVERISSCTKEVSMERKATYYLKSGREVDIFEKSDGRIVAKDGYLSTEWNFDHFPSFEEVQAKWHYLVENNF
jgi:hypothetical protein